METASFIEAAKIVGKADIDNAFDDLCDELDPAMAGTLEEFTQAIKGLDPEYCNYYQVAVCVSGGDDAELSKILKAAHKRFTEIHPC